MNKPAQRQIYVYADWVGLAQPTLMGVLSATLSRGKEIFSFEYNEGWLKNPNAQVLDPSLQLLTGTQYAPHEQKSFGLFLDSSPDRWGRVLMNRREAQLARNEERKERRLVESDYLLGVHDQHRMGALRFRLNQDGNFLDDNDKYASPPFASLRALEQASLALEKDGAEENPAYSKWLQMLIAPGGSLGGARPKASVIDTQQQLWIAKFPSTHDGNDIGAWEMVIYELAKNAGVVIAEANLQKFNSRHHTFLSKRFDRAEKGKRIHFSSAMTLLQRSDGDDASNGVSYLELAEFIMRQGARPDEDLEQLWRRIVFYICVSNVDDHLRNHGFLLEPHGWVLSPAFDINPVAHGHGLKLNISETDNSQDLALAKEVAEYFRIKSDRAVNLRDLGSARELVSAGAAERDNDERLSLFLLAAASCDLAALQQLAVGPNFADANQVDAYGRNAIILAIRNGSAFESDITRVVSYLISIGTDPNISDNQGVQAIIRAIEKRMPAVVEVIWSHSRYLPGIFDRTHFTKYFYTVKDFRRALKFSIDRIKSLDSELFANEILFILLSPLTWKTTTHLRNQSIARDQLLAELTIIEARLPIIISSVIENGANPEVCLDKYYTEVEQSSSKSPIGICNIIIKNIAQFLFSEQERQLLLSAVTDAKQQMEAVVKKRAMQKQEDAERKSLNERIVYAAEEETRSPGLPATSPTLPDTVLHEPESRKVAQEILDELIYAVEQSGSAADSALKDEVVTLVENLNDSAIPVTETIAELRQVDTSEASCEVSAAFKAFISALSTAIACGLLFALVGAAATSWSGPGIVIGAIAGFIAGLIAGSIGAKCCLFSDTQQEEISPMHNHQMILCR